MQQTPAVARPFNCICCNRSVETAMEGTTQPYAATSFNTIGHYGSTVFDPMDGSYLSINVCDDCLVKAAARGVVRYTTRQNQRSLWQPDQPTPAPVTTELPDSNAA